MYDPKPKTKCLRALIVDFGSDPADVRSIVSLARSLHRNHVRWKKLERGLSDWNKRQRNDARDLIDFARGVRDARVLA